MPTRRLGLFCFLFCCSCAAPRAAITLSPDGHGQLLARPAPVPIAWRSNALAAPCALQCRDAGENTGISCACHSVDSIYYSHLEHTAQAQADNADGEPQVVAD